MTPPSALAGGTDPVQATDELGTTTTLTYTRMFGLANYTPLSPYRILDTRHTGGPLGPGAVRALQVTGNGVTQIPADATAAVLPNVTEVNGSASKNVALAEADTQTVEFQNRSHFCPAHNGAPRRRPVRFGVKSQVRFKLTRCSRKLLIP